jgi:hypothetical protein
MKAAVKVSELADDACPISLVLIRISLAILSDRIPRFYCSIGDE